MQTFRWITKPWRVYLGADGDLDLAVAIRTLVRKGDTFEVTAGAGVVEASDPQSEADETRNKARGVLCAIEAAPASCPETTVMDATRPRT